MSLPANIDEIAVEVQRDLADTSFACSALHPLSGGNANFVFRGSLTTPLSDGTTNILVKHGEDYVSSNPSFKLTTSRCTSRKAVLTNAGVINVQSAEAESLRALASLPPARNEFCTVRTPALHYFAAETNTQIQEYLDQSISLKNYALKHYSPSTPVELRDQCRGLGRGLGGWLKNFHAWAAGEHASLRRVATANAELKAIKHMTYYDHLVMFVDRFPALLGEARAVIEQVKAMADAELADDEKLQVVHGDFWTGNALLPDRPISAGDHTPMFIVDWEVASLGVPARDIGQMIAELYMLELFRGIDAGRWMVEGYLQGYGVVNEETAFRVAIHVGAHLVVIGGSVAGWGSPEDVDRVVSFGREMIVHAWQKDKTWFAGSTLESLFA